MPNSRMIIMILVLSFMSLFCSCQPGDEEWTLESPDRNIRIIVSNKSVAAGDQTFRQLSYQVKYNGTDAVLDSRLGIDREDAVLSGDLKPVSQSTVRLIDEKYVLKSGKCHLVHNFAQERVLTFKNRQGKLLELVLRAYNDGIAFRYRFPEFSDQSHKVIAEYTEFSIPRGGKAWIHPYDWNSRLKPSYEQYCENEIPVGSPSPNEKGWAFPMLFSTGGQWIMITEAVMDGTYCGTHIGINEQGVYNTRFAEAEEVVVPDPPEPVSTLPWTTPWRAIILGRDLAAIVETNLVQNLNEPCRILDTDWIIPGRSSWSWWSEGGSPRDFKKQIEYVDFTAGMGWEYMLIDAGWPEMKGGKMEEVVQYADSKNVGIWLWYHSGAGIRKDTVTVRNIMSVPEARKSEFARLQALDVKGVKIDFFDTDKQSVVKLYYEILQDAADHKIMVNFHGASLPRGSERTWPNLMTVEAVRGAEGLGRQERCDNAPLFHTILPFTRNVVGPMDYTPVTFSNKIRQGVEAFQRTSYAHQLALSVIFESGVQNFADRYTSYQALPEDPKNFLKKVPVEWDETCFVGGYPGDYVIMARRKGGIWYIAGISGRNEKRKLSFDLPFIEAGKNMQLITDGTERTTFSEMSAKTGSTVIVELLPYSGFAGTVE